MKSLFAEPLPVKEKLLPKGFRYASAACGLKSSKRSDLALILSDADTAAAGLFTTNRVQAAPVILSRQHLKVSGGNIRAIIANSGNANCATGAAGLAAARATAARVAAEAGCRAEQVLICSTGVIGAHLQVEKILDAVPALVTRAENSPAAAANAAEAIMTTDTRRKWASANCKIGGGEVNLLGMAKGSGMIHPQMATMLAFVVTDAAITRALAKRALEAAVRNTFNCVTVDGDTSTNDTLLLIANGASGAPNIYAAEADYEGFLSALESVCKELALAITADGEGATRVAEIEVRGAPSDEAASCIARTIANSPLVKTAIAGADPNWGRVLAAAGRTVLPRRGFLDLSKVEIQLGGVTVCRHGQAHPFDQSAVHRKMLEEHVPVVVDLKSGDGQAKVWTCDLTADYIRINTAYRS